MPDSDSTPAKPDRIAGYDVARSVAIAGMVVVHFTLVLAPDGATPAWLFTFVHEVLDGRAAATFMVLAGVGLTLLNRRAFMSGDPAEITRARKIVRNRGWFLLVVGFVNLMVWSGDILRVYGVALLVAAALLDASNRRLLGAAALAVAGFVPLFLLLDYDKHWNWDTMEYRGLWTAEGLVRSLFYDGFRSVFPWSGFVFYGMWLGRRDLTDPRTNRRFLFASAAIAVATELASRGAVAWLTGERGWNREEAVAFFGTVSMPPLPVFLFAAASTATAVIALCVRLAAIPLFSPILRPFAATGRLALTWYLGHIAVVVSLWISVDAGVLEKTPLPAAVASGLAFFGGSAVASTAWLRRFRSGPLEAVMRAVTG